MEKDYGKSIVQTLDRFFNDMSLCYNNKGYIEYVGKNGCLPVAFSPHIKRHRAKKLRRVRSQSCN